MVRVLEPLSLAPGLTPMCVRRPSARGRRSWGLSPQKPIRRAYEQDPESVRRWQEEDYPAIAARARREGALILWLDQTGIRSGAAVGRTWAPTGQTPVVGKTGKRFSVNAMCAIGNKGELYFTVYTGSFNAGVFIPFLDRLTHHLGRKVHLIVDGHGVHRRKTVQQWIAEHAADRDLCGLSKTARPVFTARRRVRVIDAVDAARR
ncbi:IS630 family transposase [Saccharopolyspora sp. 5N102]|uniref:IS630 family transposase n=1 Tax=Saccharopolyspora sp. 5N102 TaxID=3375155 RepID=UPI0037AFAA16